MPSEHAVQCIDAELRPVYQQLRHLQQHDFWLYLLRQCHLSPKLELSVGLPLQLLHQRVGVRQLHISLPDLRHFHQLHELRGWLQLLPEQLPIGVHRSQHHPH